MTERDFAEDILETKIMIIKDNKTDVTFRAMFLLGLIVSVLVKKFWGIDKNDLKKVSK